MKRNIFILFALSILLVGCGSKTDSTEKEGEAVAIAKPKIKPTVNFYVENSGSMFGYVTKKSGNDFDSSLSSLLTQIIVSEYTDSLNMFYINSKIFKRDVDIPVFIKEITRTNQFQGNLGSTDMCQLFETITSTVDDKNVSIMVSDCIFSPGNGVNAMNYIGAEKNCITLKLHEKVKNQDLAFVVYRMISNFNGTYYDCEDYRTNIDDDRPYFIWIVGTKENIAEFNKKGIEDKIEGRLENSYTIFNSDDKPSYAVQFSPTIGSFDHGGPSKITKAKPEGESGLFMFTVAVDFSSLLLDDDYLTNADNYNVRIPNYNIEIMRKQIGKYTHEIRVNTSSKYISPVKLSIQLKNNIPSWIEEYSDDACTHINTDGMMEKTYGLKHLVDGIYSAYNFKNDVLAEITIDIN